MNKPNAGRSQTERPRAMRDIGGSIVLAYQENVDQLTNALSREGFTPIVQRAEYSEAELAYTKNSRTFLNHKRAWERAAASDGYTLICESDFVPCKGMGEFPVFWPVGDEMAWGYLYQGSPRLLALDGSTPWLRGHCAPLVAYVVNAPVARILLQFFEEELARYSLMEYFTFDAHLQWFAMGRGCRAYIPAKHYGEHGGVSNAEHRTMGMLQRSGIHQADNLMAPLHFLPPYAHGSGLKYARVRLFNRLLGWARLLTGRWMVRTNVYTWSTVDRMRMFFYGLRRLL